MNAKELLANCCEITNELAPEPGNDQGCFHAGGLLAHLLAPLFKVAPVEIAAEIERVLAEYRSQQDAIPPRDPSQPWFAKAKA